MGEIEYSAGATAPGLLVVFTRDGQPEPLADATVTATITRGDVLAPLTKTVTPVHAAQGEFLISWLAGDLAVPDGFAGDFVTYEVAYSLVRGGGGVERPVDRTVFPVYP